MKTPQMELRNFQSNTFKGISQKIVEITKSSSFWKVISIWNVRPTVVARYLWQPCQQEPPLHAATNSPVTLKGIQWSILTWLHTYQCPKVRGWKEIGVQINKDLLNSGIHKMSAKISLKSQGEQQAPEEGWWLHALAWACMCLSLNLPKLSKAATFFTHS